MSAYQSYENINYSTSIILGSGPAGYTAAIYASRARLFPCIIRGNRPGGQMTTTTDVENYPGFPDVIQGPWLMLQMKKQAYAAGTRIINDNIFKVDLNTRPFSLYGSDGSPYRCESLIICTGAKPKKLNIPYESSFYGYGVEDCELCEYDKYRDKSIIVAGGGSTAVEKAIFFSSICRSVLLIARGPTLTSERILADRMFQIPNINVLMGHTVESIFKSKDNKSFEGVTIKSTFSGDIKKKYSNGLFVAIGHVPCTDIFKNKIDMTPDGYIKTEGSSSKTSVEGVFAAGDACDGVYSQAITAAAQGCRAAIDMEKYLVRGR